MYRLNLPRQFLPKPPASSVPILHLPRSDATFGSKILLVLVRIQVLTLSRNTFNLSNSQVKSTISFKKKEKKKESPSIIYSLPEQNWEFLGLHSVWNGIFGFEFEFQKFQNWLTMPLEIPLFRQLQRGLLFPWKR